MLDKIEIDPPDVVSPMRDDEIRDRLPSTNASVYENDFNVPDYKEPQYATFDVEFERYKVNVGIWKWLIGTVGFTIVTFIINWGFKDRAAGLDEIEHYDRYVTEVIVLNKEVGPRRLLAQYFSMVTASETLRERWVEYYNDVNKEYQQTLRQDSLTKAKIVTLINNSVDSNLTSKDKARLDLLQEQAASLERQLNAGVILPSDTQTGEWVVVVSGDISLEKAQFEAQKAKRQNLNTIIYKKQNVFRTVVGPYIARSEAQSHFKLVLG